MTSKTCRNTHHSGWQLLIQETRLLAFIKYTNAHNFLMGQSN
jgi:hypothetical protein